MKRLLGSVLMAAALALPGLAPSALAASADGGGPAASSHNLSLAIRGAGTIKTDDGTATFRLRAGTRDGEEHGNFKYHEGGGVYNGGIHGYTINGNTATITGDGGLADENGVKHHVRFTLTAVAGGPGTGSMDMTFTGKNYNMHCTGTLTEGLIQFLSPSN